jgi:hypothetical protein
MYKLKMPRLSINRMKCQQCQNVKPEYGGEEGDRKTVVLNVCRINIATPCVRIVPGISAKKCFQMINFRKNIFSTDADGV